MNDIARLLEMNWKDGVLFIAAVIIVVVFVIQKFDWIVERFGIMSKRQMAEAKQDNDIKELKDHANHTDENINKILDRIEDMKGSVDGISTQVTELQKKNDINEAARLKDRISEGYRYYNERKQWTSMEKESMEEMIKAYSQYSENSFVHSIVERDMPTWKVIDE